MEGASFSARARSAPSAQQAKTTTPAARADAGAACAPAALRAASHAARRLPKSARRHASVASSRAAPAPRSPLRDAYTSHAGTKHALSTS